MPRYFFDLIDGDTVSDNEGSELVDVQAAYREATVAARELMAERIKGGIDCSRCSFRVRGAGGEVAFTMPFSDAIREAGC